MKKRIIRIPIILIATFLLFGFALNKSMLISPGQGLGNFIIYKSSKKDVEKELGFGITSKSTNYSDHGPYDSNKNYHRLEYKELGLLFSFDIGSEIISEITISKECDCATADGIKVGSTKAEVYKKFGEIPLESDTRILNYKSAGIGFEFATSHKNTEANLDSVTKIKIFKPR